MSKSPKHVAIIMDGNGRWATQQKQPRCFGHQAGVDNLHDLIDLSAELGVESLTLWVLSQENFKLRPKPEVSFLIDLFERLLIENIKVFHDKGIRLDFVGDLTVFSVNLRSLMQEAMNLTRHNQSLRLNIAINFSGRWHIVEAVNQLLRDFCSDKSALKMPVTIDVFNQWMSKVADFCDPDLLIRTGGECRMSDFMMWHLSWSELYFTDLMWPDFDRDAYQAALSHYGSRKRRFGLVKEPEHA